MTKLKAGLLPLYIKLYDDINPVWRKPLEAYVGKISAALGKLGVEIETVPVCRIKPEFERAVKTLEGKGLDALMTLHLAYSPSLESSSILAKTCLPLIILDTTPDFAFGPDSTPDLIMNNHGIHGVQDMCNLLLRNNKPFAIEAGHWEKSDVLRRVADQVRAARLASVMRSARVGLIGKPFAGMGDFSVPSGKLRKTLGVTTVAVPPSSVGRLLPGTNDAIVKQERLNDLERYDCGGLDKTAHLQSIRTGIAVERFIARGKLTAVTLNFQEVTKKSGLPVMPFLGMCKAMANGSGYAGEGDVLTAALVGSLMRVYPETSFTEMFCPDWKGGRVFLSHMGEINPMLAEKKPKLYVRDPWSFSDAAPPVSVGACFKPGKALFVNLAPGYSGYTLIAAPVTMVSGGKNRKFDHTVSGWFKPELPLSDFLEEYSRAGGTHHAALVYSASIQALSAFSRLMKIQFKVIK
ncbi:MAG: hypothetical protein V1913_00455 [Fibrobacterota bacterium]